MRTRDNICNFEFHRKRPDINQYRKWRKAVMKRDGGKCKRCGGKKILQIHHIKRYEDYPHLRWAVENGITLCKKCHLEMKGKEEAWEKVCNLLIGDKKLIVELGRLLHEERLKDEQV